MSTTPLMRPSIGAEPEQQVGLLAGVAELLQVLDRVEACPPVGEGRRRVLVGVGVVVHGDADEGEELRVAGLHMPGIRGLVVTP